MKMTINTCLKCNAEGCTKDGIIKGRQRYKCKSCGYRHTIRHKRGVHADIKRQALILYLEGLGFRSIGRLLKCSHVAVYNWIKVQGESIDTIRSRGKVEVIELDEMHTYIGSKKTIAGSGLLLIDMENNSSIVKLVPAIQKQRSGPR